MRVLYIHGIGSGRRGANTVQWFKKEFPEDAIFSFDIPIEPDRAIQYIKEKCLELDINAVIGTSLGGFYAMQIPGVQKILINPAIKAFETVEKIGKGEHKFFCVRDDGIDTYTIDDAFIAALRRQYEKFLEVMDEETVAETYAIFGTEDDICQYSDLFKKTYRESQMMTEKFGHRMTEEIFKKCFKTMYEKVKKDFDTRKW